MLPEPRPLSLPGRMATLAQKCLEAADGPTSIVETNFPRLKDPQKIPGLQQSFRAMAEFCNDLSVVCDKGGVSIKNGKVTYRGFLENIDLGYVAEDEEVYRAAVNRLRPALGTNTVDSVEKFLQQSGYDDEHRPSLGPAITKIVKSLRRLYRIDSGFGGLSPDNE